VTSYSSLAKDQGPILHTKESIAYEVPWRQDEAMLLDAASRSTGLKTEPAPFVLQKDLSDFTVIYEINAHTREPGKMNKIQTKLHLKRLVMAH